MSRNLALIALAVAMQGCQPSDPEPRNTPSSPSRQERPATPDRGTTEVRLSYWGVGMALPDGSVAGAAARIDGVLSRVGGCLVVAVDGGTRVHPVFPAARAQWNSSTGTLTLAGAQYRLGDRITLGGGGVASPSAYLGEAGVQIAACEVRDLWVVIV